jgi:hypothetical protein
MLFDMALFFKLIVYSGVLLYHRLCMEFSLSCTVYPEPVFKIIR